MRMFFFYVDYLFFVGAMTYKTELIINYLLEKKKYLNLF